MHCRIKVVLRKQPEATYALYRDACVGEKLHSPCTLILPDSTTLKSLTAKLDKLDKDGNNITEVGNALKALILTQPHAPPLNGAYRNILAQDVNAVDGQIEGVAVEHLHTITDGARVLFEIYQAKGPLRISGEARPMPRTPKPDGGARRVPRRRGGGDQVAAMIAKHRELITSGSGCSPFAEAMCYQLAALQIKGDVPASVLAAVRLVASYDPAVFFTSLGIDTSTPVIPHDLCTIGSAAAATSYDKVLGQFLAKGDEALATCFASAGCDMAKVCASIKARRAAFTDANSIQEAYNALGGFFSKCKIDLSGEQKMRADKVADLVCLSREEGPDAYTAAISAPVSGLPRGERYFHLISREESANTPEELDYKRYYTASVCSAEEQSEVLSYIKSLSAH